MDSVKLLPSPAYATGTLSALPVNLHDPDGDGITCSYAWKVNGKPVGGDSIQLDPSMFKIGDLVVVTVTPTDSWGVQGDPVTAAPVTILTDLGAKAPGSPRIAIRRGERFKDRGALGVNRTPDTRFSRVLKKPS
jgi:hypothetical protein